MRHLWQELYGKRGFNATLSEIEKDAQKLRQGLETASRSNSDLHQIMERNVGHLQLLTGPLEQLQAALPSVAHIQCRWNNCCTCIFAQLSQSLY